MKIIKDILNVPVTISHTTKSTRKEPPFSEQTFFILKIIFFN